MLSFREPHDGQRSLGHGLILGILRIECDERVPDIGSFNSREFVGSYSAFVTSIDYVGLRGGPQIVHPGRILVGAPVRSDQQ